MIFPKLLIMKLIGIVVHFLKMQLILVRFSTLISNQKMLYGLQELQINSIIPLIVAVSNIHYKFLNRKLLLMDIFLVKDVARKQIRNSFHLMRFCQTLTKQFTKYHFGNFTKMVKIKNRLADNQTEFRNLSTTWCVICF